MTNSTFYRCVINGTIFGITHLIFGIIVYFLLIGISLKSTLALLCAFIFIIISIIFFIAGCQQFCSFQKDQFPYFISTAILSLFASVSCFYTNTRWLASTNMINRIPFYLIIIVTLFFSFTITLVTLFMFLNFSDFSQIFKKRGTILCKFICDLLISLILSFLYGFTYSDGAKKTSTSSIAFILFAVVPCLLYTLNGCLLECYSRNIDDTAEPLAQL